MTGSPTYLVVPMVSFCDIPVQLSREHRRAYGRYAIGLSKDWGRAKGLTPLLYLSEGSPLTIALSKQHRAITKSTLDFKDFGEVWPLLPYLKPVFGAFPDACTSGRDYTGIKHFDQEMEWRFVPQNHLKDIFSTRLYDWDARDRSKLLNVKTETTKLTFDISDIERIVVPTPRQKRELSTMYSALRRKIKTWKDIPLI